LKFNVVIVLSNVVLLFFILLGFLFPFVALGPRSAGVFWQSAWPVAVFLFLVMIAMNLFYALNFRLYHLLEREDWPALVGYLEKRIIEKGRCHSFGVRLLANTYLLLSDNEAFANLENKVAAVKPALLENLALVFGTGRLIRRDYAGAVRFFDDRLAARDKKKRAPGAANAAVRSAPAESLWLFWYSGFALLFNARYAAAAERFAELARTTKDPMVTALAAWFLERILVKALPEQQGEFAVLAEDARKRVKILLPRRSAWDKKTETIRDEIYAIPISGYLQSIADWLYNGE
jgi:hypothetical protein